MLLNSLGFSSISSLCYFGQNRNCTRKSRTPSAKARTRKSGGGGQIGVKQSTAAHCSRTVLLSCFPTRPTGSRDPVQETHSDPLLPGPKRTSSLTRCNHRSLIMCQVHFPNMVEFVSPGNARSLLQDETCTRGPGSEVVCPQPFLWGSGLHGAALILAHGRLTQGCLESSCLPNNVSFPGHIVFSAHSFQAWDPHQESKIHLKTQTPS